MTTVLRLLEHLQAVIRHKDLTRHQTANPKLVNLKAANLKSQMKWQIYHKKMMSKRNRCSSKLLRVAQFLNSMRIMKQLLNWKIKLNSKKQLMIGI